MGPRCFRTRALRSAALAAALLIGRFALAQEESYPTARFAGFADVTFDRSTRKDDSQFEFGEIDPYAEVRFSDSWSALAEVLFQRLERGSEADIPGHRRYELDLERCFAAYSPSDAFRLRVGEVNTGIIQWNESEERPRFLQTSIDIPSIARRPEQGGAWPLHLVGAWASGRIPGTAGLRYGAGLGAGRGHSRDDIAFLSGSASLAGLVSVSFTPDALPGGQIAAAALIDDIPAPEGTYREIDETLSASYVSGPVELRAEWSRMDHRLQRTGRTHVTRGWYALLSVRLPDPLRRLRPYVLVDRLDVAQNEPYLADVLDQRAWAAGLRWDAARRVALKVDFQSQRARTREAERRIRAELAVAF